MTLHEQLNCPGRVRRARVRIGHQPTYKCCICKTYFHRRNGRLLAFVEPLPPDITARLIREALQGATT